MEEIWTCFGSDATLPYVRGLLVKWGEDWDPQDYPDGEVMTENFYKTIFTPPMEKGLKMPSPNYPPSIEGCIGPIEDWLLG